MLACVSEYMSMYLLLLAQIPHDLCLTLNDYIKTALSMADCQNTPNWVIYVFYINNKNRQKQTFNTVIYSITAHSHRHGFSHTRQFTASHWLEQSCIIICLLPVNTRNTLCYSSPCLFQCCKFSLSRQILTVWLARFYTQNYILTLSLLKLTQEFLMSMSVEAR